MVQLHNATLLSSRGNYATTAHLKDRFFIKQRFNEPLYFSEQVCSWGKLIDTSKSGGDKDEGRALSPSNLDQPEVR